MVILQSMLTISIFYLFIISYILSIISLSIQYNHLLISLFCLEAIILISILTIIVSSISTYIYIPQISIIILTMGACEARLGLRIIVIISRSTGSDILSNVATIKC